MKTKDLLAEGKSAEQIDLNTLNVKMSADRMLMAWTNMTLSMISFGFAIYEILQGRGVAGAVLPGADTPRNVGAYLVGAGTIAITMGMVTYVRSLLRLRARQYFSLAQPPLIIALMISALGGTLCIVIARRML